MIDDFNIETERRSDGWYWKMDEPGMRDGDWHGPYESPYDCKKYARLVFYVEG